MKMDYPFLPHSVRSLPGEDLLMAIKFLIETSAIVRGTPELFGYLVNI